MIRMHDTEMVGGWKHGVAAGIQMKRFSSYIFGEFMSNLGTMGLSFACHW